MKRRQLVVVIAGLLGSACGAQQAQSNQLDELIAQSYDLTSDALMFSTTQKYLGRGGDAVGIALAHMVGQNSVSDKQAERICLLLEAAFRWPDLIEGATDRKPDISVLLLESLGRRSPNPGVKAKMLDLRSRLLLLYEKH